LAGSFPDGGPIIVTTAAAASIGEGLLVNTIPALTDVDQVIVVKATFPAVSANQYALELDDGTNNNRITINVAGPITCNVIVGGVAVYSPTGFTPVFGTEYKIVLKREAGAWRMGYLLAGSMSWFSTATVATFPPGMVNVRPGDNLAGGASLNSAVGLVAVKLGTFTDVALATLLTGL
jgi:hypothetical protein